MHVQLSSASASAFGRMAASPFAAAATPRALPRLAVTAQPGGSADAPTRVTLLGAAGAAEAAGNDVAYDGVSRRANASADYLRFWAGPHDNELGALMRHNSGNGKVTLSDRWHGLGGALLRQLADTGAGTAQTLAEVKPPSDDAAATEDAAVDAASKAAELEGTAEQDPAADVAKLETDALAGVSDHAVTVGLTVTTRSGQKVSLEIAVNDGKEKGSTRGLQVKVASSGELSLDERHALAAMADGLDRALDGLGGKRPQIDLSQLMAFNGSGQLTGLDLEINDPNTKKRLRAMGAFSLHLGGDKASLSFERAGSKMALSVTAMPPGEVNGGQRRSAITAMLAQIDAAAERGHGDPLVVGLFKDAFAQLQAPPVDGQAAQPSVGSSPPTQVQALESGLADFEASFGGPTQKTNRFGGAIERGTISYQIGQSTTAKLAAGPGACSITQVKTEALDADMKKTRTLLLDPESGDYDGTTIRDCKTETTLIAASLMAVTQALRKTDEHRLAVFASVENDRVTAKYETPQDRSVVERLL